MDLPEFWVVRQKTQTSLNGWRSAAHPRSLRQSKGLVIWTQDISWHGISLYMRRLHGEFYREPYRWRNPVRNPGAVMKDEGGCPFHLYK